MREFDTMMDDMFYDPFPLQRRMARPSYLLQESPAQVANALLQSMTKDIQDQAKNTYQISQDDTQLQIVVNVPGAKASDINLQLEGDGRLLKISGETKLENEGISTHSTFEKSFVLPRNVNTDEVSAQMENSVLTITAPKLEEAKETVRRVDIVENKNAISNEAVEENKEEVSDKVKVSDEESQKKKDDVDESVIDLDAASLDVAKG